MYLQTRRDELTVPAPATGLGYPAPSYRPHEPLHPAAVRGAHLLRDEAARPLHQDVRGPDHLPRRPGRRRVGGRHHRPAHRAGEPGPRPRHPDVHQQPRRLVHGHDGDLRHDAVHPSRHPDLRDRAGRVGRGGAARRRVHRASGSPCRTAAILIHQPALAGGDYGQASDIEIQANEVFRMRTWLEETLAKHSGRTPEQVNEDIERDKILSAEEAKEYGLIDDVLEQPQGVAPVLTGPGRPGPDRAGQGRTGPDGAGQGRRERVPPRRRTALVRGPGDLPATASRTPSQALPVGFRPERTRPRCPRGGAAE